MKRKSSADLFDPKRKYGKWTILEIGSPSSLCRCECGVEKLVRNSFMVAGRVGGCHGCANKRIRMGRRKMKCDLSKEVYSRLSATVRNIFKRCLDPSCGSWKYYGGRGIRIHQEWVRSPQKFIRYLSTLQGHDDRSLVIDRIKNDEGYKPGNLRFVTRSISQQNKGPYRRRCS